MSKRTKAPSCYDHGKGCAEADPTFWNVFNEHTNPLPETDAEPERRGLQSVYFLHCPSIGRVKIGCSSEPRRRQQELASKVGRLPTVLLGSLDGGFRLEALMHQRFSTSRVSGEWFDDEIIEEVEGLIRADREFYDLA